MEEPFFEITTDDDNKQMLYFLYGWRFLNKTTFIMFVHDLITIIVPEEKRDIVYRMMDKYTELEGIHILSQYNKGRGIISIKLSNNNYLVGFGQIIDSVDKCNELYTFYKTWIDKCNKLSTELPDYEQPNFFYGVTNINTK